MRQLKSWARYKNVVRMKMNKSVMDKMKMERKKILRHFVDHKFQKKYNSEIISCMSMIKYMIPEECSKYCPEFPERTLKP